MQNAALNIVCNQEYAQSVPHVRIEMTATGAPVVTMEYPGSLPYYTCTTIGRIGTTKPTTDRSTASASDAKDRAGDAPAGV